MAAEEVFGADPALVASPSSQSSLSRPSGFDPGELLSEELMLNSFFREYAERGHWFDKAHGKCVLCEAATIDLYEDGWYGPIRSCLTGIEVDLYLARLGDYPGANGTKRIATAFDALREALTDIRNRILCPVGPSPSLDEVEKIASDALARIDARSAETGNTDSARQGESRISSKGGDL
jgi:hypothetical protein